MQYTETEQTLIKFSNTPHGKAFNWIGEDGWGGTLYTEEPELETIDDEPQWKTYTGDLEWLVQNKQFNPGIKPKKTKLAR